VKEPILRPEDHEAWAYWQRVCAVHARSPGFQRRVTQAKRYVLEALDLEPHACVMWSGGKDSTCLAHLVTHELGLTHVQLISQKDDLDYPDEEAYVRELAARWGAQLEVLRPDVSALGYLREHMAEVDEDIHSRRAGLSRAVFYDLVDRACSRYRCVMMGLRAEENDARMMRLATAGPVARLKAGRVHAHPLAWWSGLDVLTYVATRELPLLPLYRCVGYLHRERPWAVRKSWWVCGRDKTHAAWLRHYYPSLYRLWRDFMPTVETMS
jgi:3'-phosphoadenosine 5'-phosphosulfate sulfotransferase (PAPS reductase)/FAD synthetase